MDVPLLPTPPPPPPPSSPSNRLLRLSLKWTLKTLMWTIFVAWAALCFFYPTDFVSAFLMQWNKATAENLYGITGSIFMLFSAPLLIIVFLAILYVNVVASSAEQNSLDKKKKTKFQGFRLWTFPVLVDGPFGVVSAAELIGILIFAVYIIWSIYAHTMNNLRLLPMFDYQITSKSSRLLQLTALRFGTIGLFCLAFLFLPVARGSFLLRLIDIPFEHATRYHVWLGHLTMFMFTLHGVLYLCEWTMNGQLIEKVLEWKNSGISNLPGVITLLSGLLMWVTSLHTVRKNYFELFFYTHQLYVVFAVFFALHVGDFIFSYAAAGMFLFLLDRFLRFCQSRKEVKLLSATCLPCGAIELVLSKPRSST